MIEKEILSNKPATLAEVKEVLEERKKEGELGFEQQTTLAYVTKYAKLSKKKAAELMEELQNLNSKIKPAVAAKIADTLPKNSDQLRLIFANERYSLSAEEIKEVLKIVEKYSK
jgi:DNA-directed RNA polymerase subunit F